MTWSPLRRTPSWKIASGTSTRYYPSVLLLPLSTVLLRYYPSAQYYSAQCHSAQYHSARFLSTNTPATTSSSTMTRCLGSDRPATTTQHSTMIRCLRTNTPATTARHDTLHRYYHSALSHNAWYKKPPRRRYKQHCNAGCS